MSWETTICTLKTKYQSLKGQGLLMPQATAMKKGNEISGLHTTINKLTAQVSNRADDGRGGYGCNMLGHFSRDCPKN
jgi:hypothetical protein